MTTTTHSQPAQSQPALVWVSCESHRARERLSRLTTITERFYVIDGGVHTRHVCGIPADVLDEALRIKSVRRARIPAGAQLHRPWR